MPLFAKKIGLIWRPYRYFSSLSLLKRATQFCQIHELCFLNLEESNKLIRHPVANYQKDPKSPTKKFQYNRHSTNSAYRHGRTCCQINPSHEDSHFSSDLHLKHSLPLFQYYTQTILTVLGPDCSKGESAKYQFLLLINRFHSGLVISQLNYV